MHCIRSACKAIRCVSQDNAGWHGSCWHHAARYESACTDAAAAAKQSEGCKFAGMILCQAMVIDTKHVEVESSDARLFCTAFEESGLKPKKCAEYVKSMLNSILAVNLLVSTSDHTGRELKLDAGFTNHCLTDRSSKAGLPRSWQICSADKPMAECHLTRGADYSFSLELHAQQQLVATHRQLLRSEMSPQALQQRCVMWEKEV